MKMIFIQPYLSITAFDSVELPDLTVLTGVNGAGKSHLLQAIYKGDVSHEAVDGAEIVHFTFKNTTSPQPSGRLDRVAARA